MKPEIKSLWGAYRREVPQCSESRLRSRNPGCSRRRFLSAGIAALGAAAVPIWAQRQPPDTAGVAPQSVKGKPLIIAAMFDYYISPTGDDITGNGTLANPYSLTWLGTLPNRTTPACGWTTYGGKRVGLLPGNYTGGTAKGVFTSLATLMTNIYGYGVGQAIFINGGTAGSPTVIGSADAQGHYAPRTATIDFSGGTGKQPQIPVGGIGQSINGTGGFHYPPNLGNWTLDGLVIENFAQYGVVVVYNGRARIQNVSIVNCEIRGGAGLSNNNPAAIFANFADNLLIQNNKIHDNASVSNFFTGSCTAGTVSGTALTLTGTSSSYMGGIDRTPGVGANIYLSNTPGTPSSATVTVVNSPTSYTLSTSLANYSGPIYWGTNSKFPGYNYGFITFQSTNTQVLNNTFYHQGILATKDHLQSVVFSRNYVEFGSWGTHGSPPNASPVSGSGGGVSNAVTGSGMSQTWSHNIFVGVGRMLDFYGQDATANQGQVIFDHNTLYWPATIAKAPELLRLAQSTTGGQAGTLQFTNNLVWSDGPPIPSGYGWYVQAGGYTGITSNYNAYQTGISYGTKYGTAEHTLPKWQAATSQDAKSITLTSSPFSSRPSSRNISSFAVTGAAAHGSSTGGAIGALDGTGSVGCDF
jgi:hypothetical protein